MVTRTENRHSCNTFNSVSVWQDCNCALRGPLLIPNRMHFSSPWITSNPQKVTCFVSSDCSLQKFSEKKNYVNYNNYCQTSSRTWCCLRRQIKLQFLLEPSRWVSRWSDRSLPDGSFVIFFQLLLRKSQPTRSMIWMMRYPAAKKSSIK